MRLGPRPLAALLIPLLWLIGDAALAALLAALAQTLLLFLLNPEVPLTLGAFLAALGASLPQLVVVFVLLGPLLVTLGVVLSFGRTSGRGLRLRYVIRFALLDTLLLGIASTLEGRLVGPLLPGAAQAALALLISALLLAAAVLVVLAIIDLRAPRRLGVPIVGALALGFVIVLAVIADMRRVRPQLERPITLPGFAATAPQLVLEIPGLGLDALREAAARGQIPTLERLMQQGALAPLAAPPVADPLSAHVTLLSGREPLAHGVVTAARYRPRGTRTSFALLPRGLFFRTLMLDRLWERIGNDAGAVRTVAFPGVARSLGLPLAIVGDPLGWPTNRVVASLHVGALQPGASLPSLGGIPLAACAPSPGAGEGSLFFDVTGDLAVGEVQLETFVRTALAADICALQTAGRLRQQQFPVVWVRLPGFPRVAEWFYGWRPESPARGAAQREIDTFGRTVTRYLRELDRALGQLLVGSTGGGWLTVVSSHGVAPRHDAGRLLEALLGQNRPTASWEEGVAGFVIWNGPGVQAGASSTERLPPTAVLPTALWSIGLPTAQTMGPIARGLFSPAFVEQQPVVAIPSYGEPTR